MSQLPESSDQGPTTRAPAIEARSAGRGPWRWLWILLALAGWGAWFVPPTSMAKSLGWDEAMHADLPAARLSLLATGAPGLPADRERWIGVLMDCQQYPFAYPLLLSGVYRSFGLDEAVGRRFGRVWMGFGLLGLFALGAALVARAEQEPGRRWAGGAWVPFLAAGAGALSPLWLAYSGTFFLESPSAVLWAWVLCLWLARQLPRPGASALTLLLDALTGCLLAALLFTKFNYGLLLGLGLTLDHALEGIRAARTRGFRRYLLRSLALALPVALALGWWFVWPWPAARSWGAVHWDAALGFLRGNSEMPYTALSRRLWDAATFLAPGPGALALAVGCALISLRGLASSAVRLLWIVGLTSAWFVLRHPFHLDRFLLPLAVPWMALAAFGAGGLLGDLGPWNRRTALRLALPAALLIAALAFCLPLGDGSAGLLGLRQPQNAAYLHALHQERLSLAPARALPTAGLERQAYQAFIRAIAAELEPSQRLGWLGINSELSPGALHLGLYAATGQARRLVDDAARVRADGQPDMVVTFEGADPGWDAERVRAWARGFDRVFSTEPIDWKGRRSRQFLETYRGHLFEAGEWTYREIAKIPVARPANPPTQVQLFAFSRASPR